MTNAIAFAQNMRDLQAGKITADQARAKNRELREQAGDDWERSKLIAAGRLEQGK